MSYYRTFPSTTRNDSTDSRRSICSEIPPPSYQDLFPQSATSVSDIPKYQSQQQQNQDQQNQSLVPQNQSQAQEDQPPQHHQDQQEHLSN